MTIHNPIMMEQHIIANSNFVELMALKRQYDSISDKSTIDRMVNVLIEQEINSRVAN